MSQRPGTGVHGGVQNARRAVVALLLFVACLVGVQTLHAQDLPKHVGKVNDFANVLPASERDALETRLTELERATSAELAVVTIPTLSGRSVEEYATTLFNTWASGKLAATTAC